MSKTSHKKPRKDNRSTTVKGFAKPELPNFPGKKASSGFKPNSRLGSINRGRR